MDILSWEIAEVVSPCLPCGLWSHIVIRVFLLLGTVCPRHPPYPVLPSCPLLRAFLYPQPGDAGGRRSAPAICQSLTSADPICIWNLDSVSCMARYFTWCLSLTWHKVMDIWFIFLLWNVCKLNNVYLYFWCSDSVQHHLIVLYAEFCTRTVIRIIAGL